MKYFPLCNINYVSNIVPHDIRALSKCWKIFMHFLRITDDLIAMSRLNTSLIEEFDIIGQFQT